MGRRFARRVVNKDLFVGTHDPEDIVIIDDRFTSSQEEIAPVVKGHMEDGKQVSLQDILEIDEKIAAADQIQLPEGGILEYVVLREYDHLADLVPDNIMIALAGEKAAESGDADIFNDIVSVYASSGYRDGFRVQIRRKDLDIPADAQILHDLRKENGDRIGFLACGAARDPDAQLFGLRRVLDQVIDHAVLEHFKIVRIPEETGHADQHFLGKQSRLVRIEREIFDILLQVTVMGDNNAPLHAPQDRRLFIISVIDIGDIAQNGEHLRHQVSVAELEPVAGVHHRGRNVAHFPRNTVGVEYQIHKSRRDRVSGHTVELRALGRLHDDHAVLVFDRADPVRSVRTGSGHDHCNGAIFVSCRK